ncbi:MAG: cadmium-translocating P-type ATPase [Acidobacteria bacterium]|nr:cadmium-translocating P-type ATPase [Acidobacteriota bacterium]MBS1866647.1 cadmium-translocating P-type ATPase [Acidobacteriota bacterium]
MTTTPISAVEKTKVELAPGWAKFVTVVSAIAIVLHLFLRWFVSSSKMQMDLPLYIALALGGVPLLVVLIRKLWARELGSDFLAGASIVTAVLLREYLVATIVLLMFSGGGALEAFATRRASRVLEALAKRMPALAHRRTGQGLTDIRVGDIAVGDTLVVLPHEICPVDGIVIEGRGSMNEAYLTGEPFEVEKAPGSAVLSGALNGESLLTIQAEKQATDSRYARIMRVMEETQQRRPRLRRLGDMLGAWYTPLAVGIAVVAWVLSGSVERFLAVLVIATPCPLLIAIPVAVIGAVSLSARRGIIIKNPAVLEQIDSCRTFIFDKTGTLTYGKPALTRIVCAPGFSESEVLASAASIERYSKHPLAAAIVEAAKQRGCEVLAVSQVHEPPGEGLRGTVNGREVFLTGRGKISTGKFDLPPIEPGLECLVFIDGKFAALFGFEDAPRSDSRVFVTHLSPRHQVTRVILVSGDREAEVRSLAEKVGIQIAYGARTPEEKVELVRSETERAKSVFIGDGINDAPAMQAATVGIAFGHENDITSEAADAVVLERSLGKVDELIHIGRRMRKIALESAVGGMVLSAVGMALAAAGWLPPIGGAVAQELIDLAAVLNAVRVALPFGDLRDF